MRVRIVLLFCLALFIKAFISAQSISLISPLNGSSYMLPENINIESQINDVEFSSPTYLHITNSLTGYRKLKLGNNPTTLYGSTVDVVASGNTTMEITLIDFGGNCDWDNIQIRPNGEGSLGIKGYINDLNGINTHWIKISIPLSDFNSSIDFHAIQLIEIPYSTGAGSFDIGIAEIKFTGSTDPYLYWGEGKSDNIHDGHSTTGGIVATTIAGNFPAVYFDHLEFLINDSIIATSYYPPYAITINDADTGYLTIKSILVLSDSSRIESPGVIIHVSQPELGVLSAEWVTPSFNQVIYQQDLVTLRVNITGSNPLSLPFLNIKNTNTGYRKLKIGNNPSTLYSPLVNPLEGGNQFLEITMRCPSNTPDWNLIELRPMSMGRLNLAPYIHDTLTNDWFTITIPINDFDTSQIRFDQIAYLEFPYSLDAGSFEIDIQSVKFTGGTTPFLFFGEEKINNKTDGTGLNGAMTATIINQPISFEEISNVTFQINDSTVENDYFPPYQFNWIKPDLGDYTCNVIVKTSRNRILASGPIPFSIQTPPPPPSSLKPIIIQPDTGSVSYEPAIINIKTVILNQIPQGPDHLRVSNTLLTGSAKIRIGYSTTTVYGSKYDVTATGNDTLELRVIDVTGNANWPQIQLKPNGEGNLNLESYQSTAQKDNYGYYIIKIPLSAFSSTIDFTNIQYIDFPCCNGAGAFDLQVASIRFTGGTTEFEWFGATKNNNYCESSSAKMSFKLVKATTEFIIPEKVFFYADNRLITCDSVAPFEYSCTSYFGGIHHLKVKCLDNKGLIAWSDSVRIVIKKEIPQDAFIVTLNLTSSPSKAELLKAPLRYNKSFAYSLTQDDTYKDGYTHLFKLFNGGTITETGETFKGLFFTDGTGNDIQFSAGVSWISLDESMNDFHLSSNFYLIYSDMRTLLANRWDIFNHSLQHMANGEFDHDYQIKANTEYVRQKFGIRMRSFVLPAGDMEYIPYVWTNGYTAIFANNSKFSGWPNGFDVANKPNLTEFKMYKRFINTDQYDSLMLDSYIDNLAKWSINGKHYWYQDFIHRASGNTGNTIWFLMRDYLKYVGKTYGKDGLDNIWMAPGQTVFDYLQVRDSAQLSMTLDNNTLRIVIDASSLPDSIPVYSMSLLLKSDVSIASASMNANGTVTYNNNPDEKLINLEWKNPKYKTNIGIDPVESKENRCFVYPNPTSDICRLYISDLAKSKVSHYSLSDINGAIISEGTTYNLNDQLIEFKQLKDLTPGFYFLRVLFNDGFSESIKIIKL